MLLCNVMHLLYCLCEFITEKWCLVIIYNDNDGCGIKQIFLCFAFVLLVIIKAFGASKLGISYYMSLAAE